jgi:Reversibly glycosylated polypeptide
VTGPTIDIVCTTIGDGSFLRHYSQEILSAGAQDRVRIIIISDHKTDHRSLNLAVAAAWTDGINVLCPSLTDQVAFMADLCMPDMFPWNSDGRRNIGYLMSWRDGAEVMISIDDDNLPTPGWLREHGIVTAGPAEHEMAGSDGAFWNPCNLLEGSHRIFARGYPYSRRWEVPPWRRGEELCQVSVNAGLWIGDPDVDAITRLTLAPLKTTELTGSRVLRHGAWAPIDSQNTAVRHDAIPAYCYFESAKRFGDIWQGYFVQACAQHLGHHVRFGSPAADCAVRNDHSLLNDLALEYDGIMMLDKVLSWLTELKLTGSTYAEAYDCLREELQDFIPDPDNGLNGHQRGILSKIAGRMHDWLHVIERLA